MFFENTTYTYEINFCKYNHQFVCSRSFGIQCNKRLKGERRQIGHNIGYFKQKRQKTKGTMLFRKFSYKKIAP